MPVTYPGTTGTGSAAAIWAPIVTLDAVDVTASVVGAIRISAAEGAARIAELALRPVAATTFTIPGWVGKSLTIDIADMATGTPASVSRLFTGIIDTPTLDLDNRLVGLLASDNLQNLIDATALAAIDALTPGAYSSPVIFDPAARGWAHLQDRLATLPAALDLDPTATPRLTDWAPKVSPDLAFTQNHILHQSHAVSLTSRNQLINSVAIDFGYRFPRVKAEGWPLIYEYVDVTNISAHASALSWFLRKDTVEAAIAAAGGTIESITYTDMPTSTIGSWTPGPSDYLLCMGFDAVVSFDYAQVVEEQHTITVEAPNSIAAVGTLADRLSGALEGVYPPVPTAEQSMLLWKNDISGIPPQDTATPSSGNTTAADVTLTADTDRAAADAAMEALIQLAKVRIWASHRRNTVSANIPLNPAVDLDQTIELTVDGLHAIGKCVNLEHLMDTDTGHATTAFALAICSVAGTGTSHPETATAAPAGSSPATTALAGSATADFNFLDSEDHTFTVTFPGVEAVERDRAVIPLTSAYDATLTEDVFSYTWP